MATDLGPDFSEKYNAISNKLKKKFMRKPNNVSEAAGEFCNLAVECEHSEQPPYAGLCYLGAARCEGSIGNTIGEAEYLLMAARQFVKAELKLDSLHCISPAKENIEAALSCYSHAGKRYVDKSPLKSYISLEVASNLEKLKHFNEAEVYYENAIENYPDNPGHTLICLLNLASVQIKQGKFEKALSTYSRIDVIARERNHNLYIQRCEVTRLLLYLIVRPSPKILSQSIENLLERYTIDISIDEPKIDAFIINPELALHLQSMLMACKMGDMQVLINLQTEMKDYLSLEQKDLLRVLVETYEEMK